MTSEALPARDETVPANDRVARWYAPHPAQPGPFDRRAFVWLLAPFFYFTFAGAFALGVGLGALAIACFVLAPAGVLLWGALNMILTEWNGEATPEDATLLESTDAWLAHVWIVQNNVVTGQDRGVIWFDEGALGFIGHRSSFLLKSEDVARSQDFRNRLYGGLDPVTNSYLLSLQEPEDPRWRRRNVYLRIRLLKPPAADLCLDRDRFEESFQSFYRQTSDLDPQFPPLSLGPGAASIVRLRLIAMAPALAALGAVFFWQIIFRAMQPGIGSRLDVLTLILFWLFVAGLALARPQRAQLSFLEGILREEGRYPDRFARYSCLALNVPLCIACLALGSSAIFGGLYLIGFGSYSCFAADMLSGLLLILCGLGILAIGVWLGWHGAAAAERVIRAPTIVRRKS